MRLLCCSVFDGYANGQVAYAIERKVTEATKAHMAHLRPVLEFGAELMKRGPGASKDEWQTLVNAHEGALRKALEGELFYLEPHEAELLKKAVEICHIPEKFTDPNKAVKGHLSRWYAPILAVLAGKDTETTTAAEVVPTLPTLADPADKLIEA